MGEKETNSQTKYTVTILTLCFPSLRRLSQDYSDMREAHNLEAYVEWFNRLSYLVAAEIVRHENKKTRIKALEFFIQVQEAIGSWRERYLTLLSPFSPLLPVLLSLCFAIKLLLSFLSPLLPFW